MPELPEVETARLIVENAARGHRIREVTALRDPLVFDEAPAKQFVVALKGATVVGSDRRGKYFWLKLDRKPWPVIHFGMSGHVDLHEAGEKWKAPKSLKLSLTLDNGSVIVFRDPRRFGRIRLSEDPLKQGAVSRLGYDPLFDFPKPKALHAILQKRKAPIKSVLLDQSLFAGVGNWIADEVLYQARLSPYRMASSLTLSQVTTLSKKILSVIRLAVKVSADHERFPKDWLFHQRWSRGKNLKTSRGERIIHETIGGRTAAWVPSIQK